MDVQSINGVLSAIDEGSSCPQGWLEYEDYCYSIEDHEETWLSAHEYCKYMGANLVSFQDNAEAEFIKGMSGTSNLK